MEDVKAYIDSGILEAYILGDVTQAEKQQVEAMSLQYPEIKAELAEIEKSLENYAGLNAVEPPDELRDRILNSVLVNLGDDRNFKSIPQSSHQGKVVALQQQKKSNFYKYAFAACLALLIASVAALFTVYNRLQNANGQILAMQTQTQKYASRVNLLDRQLGLFRDPSFQMVRLDGTTKTPRAGLMVAYSPAKKEVMIDMSRAKMPENDAQHSYQLWAIVAGKPVDLGVFDASADSTGLKEMKPVAEAQAFAVTLENRGGSPTPTMENMMVVGKTLASL